ncbi:MAG TPA: efflux RND transporter periplasmic adaptor subunit, partial [Betaproteobacteria bacterium]|nr:efflux RND transporter periplasmic adaptor subunit [Betaproteobacteria bacterium]
KTDIVPGTVVSAQQVQVASRLMGYIRGIDVHEGQTVKAGQLLFTIDPTDIRGQVNQARAGLAQAEAALVDARADFVRFGNLYREESIPKQQFDKIKLQYRIARSRAMAAKAGLRTAAAQLRYAKVRAPIDGVIVQKLAAAGDLATPGRPLLVLENPAALQVQTTVSSDTYNHLTMGETVPVMVDGFSKRIDATVIRIVPAADPITHTYSVKLALPKTAGLHSGAFVRVYFSLGQRQAIRIPQTAVLERAGIRGVFVVDRQGFAHYRMVRTGARADGGVEILAGLNPGDRIVAAGAGTLQSGDKVQAKARAAKENAHD